MDTKKSIAYGLKGVSVLFGIIGLYLIITNYTRMSPQERDTSDLNEIVSIVHEKTEKQEKVAGEDPDDTQTVYEVTVEYSFGGQKFYKTKAVDKNYYEKLFKGDSLKIYADPANPTHVVIPDSRTSTESFFNRRFLAAVLLLAAAVGVWLLSSKMENAPGQMTKPLA